MRKVLILGGSFVAALGSGALAYWQLRPEPPPPVAVEQKYEDIKRAEYEKWMQDLGYTE